MAPRRRDMAPPALMTFAMIFVDVQTRDQEVPVWKATNGAVKVAPLDCRSSTCWVRRRTRHAMEWLDWLCQTALPLTLFLCCEDQVAMGEGWD
eukprot:4467844-Ditylum_brightwellii.AAC.1